MIFGALHDSAVNDALSPHLKAGLDYLRNTDLKSLPLGRHDIAGDDLFVLLQDNLTRPAQDCRWEAHRKYADIQLVIDGVEAMGVTPIAGLAVSEPYNDTKDVMFFTPPATATTLLVVAAGQYAVFLPPDAHRPLIAVGEPTLVRKAVVKVRVG